MYKICSNYYEICSNPVHSLSEMSTFCSKSARTLLKINTKSVSKNVPILLKSGIFCRNLFKNPSSAHQTKTNYQNISNSVESQFNIFAKYVQNQLKISLSTVNMCSKICLKYVINCLCSAQNHAKESAIISQNLPKYIGYLPKFCLKSDQNVIFKIFLITVQIMLKISPKSAESLSNNCSKYVQNLSTIGLQYNTNGRNFIESGKFCRLYNIMLKICSKPVYDMANFHFVENMF